MNDEQYTEELLLRRECREMLELSTQQLEEMCEKKVRAHADAQASTQCTGRHTHPHHGLATASRPPPIHPSSQGEFGNEYRVVTAAWYMMMLPFTTLRSHLIAPDDASKAAWDFQEREYERRRVMGTKWRTIREDETVFDEERAKSHPYELGQTRRRTEITISIPFRQRRRRMM